MFKRITNFFWGKGGFFDMGDRYPVLDKRNESTIPNLFVVGDVAGTPDIKAALNAGYDAAHLIAKRFTQTPAASQYTVAILGAGPAGLNAANECKKLGVPYIVFERKEILSSIKVFKDELPLYYPSTGEPRIRGDLPFEETTAKDLLDLWTPMIESMQLNIREHEEVKGIRKKGCFVITTTKGEYLAAALIVAAGKLTFLQKLGVAVEYDPRVAYTLSSSEDYAGKQILIHGVTSDSIDAALSLASKNTVTVLEHRLHAHLHIEAEYPAFYAAVRRGSIRYIENADLHELGVDEAVLVQNIGEHHHTITVPNDIVLPFTGVVKAMVDHREMPEMMNITGLKFENTWDWKRYTWLGLAMIASGVFYIEKKTEYAAIGLGSMLGIIAVAIGGYYFIRSVLNGIETLRFGGFKNKLLVEGVCGGVLAALGYWAFSQHLVDIWPRSLGAWYPALYSVLVVTFGVKAILRWRDSIQTKKTLTLIFFQLFFYWILPEFIIRNWLSYTLVYVWPLVLAPHTIRAFLDPSFDAGLFYFWWAIILTVVLMPAFVAATGKKYCSWVCGCGGLAETVGDTFRQYAPKGKKNIDRERSLYAVTGIALVLTIVVGVLTLFDFPFQIAGVSIGSVLEKSYSWGVDWALVSFIPIALYPFFGGKIWCRYWCPTALYMQVLSKWLTKRKLGYFKIDANPERCIACNLCSRYCEVGIDVMRFALKGTVIDNVNSSCIGCGVCISVCPTDVLTFGETKPGQFVQISMPSHG